MTAKPYRTASGRTVSDAEIDEVADGVAGAEFDVSALKERRRGRPPIGSAPAGVVPVRLDPELKAALDARATADEINGSEVIRRALRSYLHVA